MSGSHSKNWGDYFLYSLINKNNTRVDVSNLGATIVNFIVETNKGYQQNITLGYDTPEQYIQGNYYFGCVVGPWANRISQGKCIINNATLQLEMNEGSNHLHGASANLGAKCWQVQERSNNHIIFTCEVNKGQAGYPCNIAFSVKYTLSNNDELIIEYSATPDEDTPINMTQHSYFNLDGSLDILDHTILINSQYYLHVDDNAIPDQITPVENTPFDLRHPTRIGENINNENTQLQLAGGFDHCWVLDKNINKLAAKIYSHTSNLSLEVYTDQMGIQFYTGNFIEGEVGRSEQFYSKRSGLCLETQCFPNQVNMDNKLECIFNSKKPYYHQAIYKIQK